MRSHFGWYIFVAYKTSELKKCLRRLMIVCMLLTCGNCSGKALADSLSMVAYSMYKTGDYSGALNSYIQLLKIAHSEKDCIREAYALQQVGRMHYLLRDENQAFIYSFVAIKMTTTVMWILLQVIHCISSVLCTRNP